MRRGLWVVAPLAFFALCCPSVAAQCGRDGFDRSPRTAVELKEPTTERASVMLDWYAAPICGAFPPFTGAKLAWRTGRQQRLRNCPLVATLVAVARVCPGSIRSMLQQAVEVPYRSPVGERVLTGPSTFQVQFNRSPPIRISPRLHYPLRDDPPDMEPENVLFATAGDGAWLAYLEKAYVVWRGGGRYEALEDTSANPITVQKVFLDVVGAFDQMWSQGPGAPRWLVQNVTSEDMGSYEGKQKPDMLGPMLARAKHRPTLAISRAATERALTANHAYVVLGQRGVTVRLWDAETGNTVRMNVRRFWIQFSTVLQARMGQCP